CDWDAERQVKLFVVLSDITEDAGPFTLLQPDVSEKIRDQVRYRYGYGHGQLPDEVVEKHRGDIEERILLGDAGTAALIDTSRCFHYGSRVGKGAPARIMAVFQFVPPTAYCLPLKFRRGAPYAHLATDDLPLWKQQVLGGA
ncbi:MAG: hypothetical protein AAF492_17065, partial [Verrucomicrobiota bacterium]